MSEQERAATVGAGRLAALYARKPQYNELDRTTVEEQLARCRALALALGYTLADEAILSDDAPNTAPGRPGLTALIGLIAQRRAAALVVSTLDRLGRPESEGLDALLKELRRREIPLYIAKTPKGYYYDPATGHLLHDPALVTAANREDARPPEYIVIPRENERGD
ncbi:MAG TPA: recombinase family protein [Thermomicrobiales bacterium]|nr:recombinase family protein [Thermomicrobiales bacterium]